jgi:hypothetical protein
MPLLNHGSLKMKRLPGLLFGQPLVCPQGGVVYTDNTKTRGCLIGVSCSKSGLANLVNRYTYYGIGQIDIPWIAGNLIPSCMQED